MFLCGNFALKPLHIGEIMSNNKIMQFSYFYWNTNEIENDLISQKRLQEIIYIHIYIYRPVGELLKS